LRKYPTSLLQRILIWDFSHEEEAKIYASKKQEESTTVLIMLINSNEWLNKNIRAGDVIIQ